jgi:hypothetical protein
MHSQLYIPKTITVGFQKRTDTFTGKLAYVIYTDHTGKLRKEASWNSWRSKDIEPVTVDNTPQNGFTFNKGVKRDGYWGSGRSVIRVWDPRDFEFEISVDNLIGILMHADVSKRDITEPCVFAWNGTELLLLPTNSLEYQESLKHTAKQGKKFSSRDLVIGHTYGIKKDSTTRVVYLGRLQRFEVQSVASNGENDRYSGRTCAYRQVQKKEKGHVFMDVATNEVLVKDPSAYIDTVVSDEVLDTFPAMMDKYYSSAESQPIIGAGLRHGQPGRYGYNLTWFQVGEEFVEITINESHHSDITSVVSKFARFDPTTNRLLVSHDGYQASRYYSHERSWNPYNPTSLTGTSDAVVAKMQQINAAIAEIYPAKTGGWIPYEDRAKYRKALSEKTGLGDLVFKLQDGKLAADHDF